MCQGACTRDSGAVVSRRADAHLTGVPAPVPPTLRGLDLEAHLADPARKQRFVTPMFDIIAPRYDAFTRVFSFGMDATWKAELLAALRGHVRERCGRARAGACREGRRV